MAGFIVLWPYLLTTKLRCLQKNNIGHTTLSALYHRLSRNQPDDNTPQLITLNCPPLIFTNNIFCRLQLNKYETEPYFLQFFQSNMTVCLIIYEFCKSEREPEIVLKIKTVIKIKTKTISRSCSQILQNA
jgi:hypothetical protein